MDRAIPYQGAPIFFVHKEEPFDHPREDSEFEHEFDPRWCKEEASSLIAENAARKQWPVALPSFFASHI